MSMKRKWLKAVLMLLMAGASFVGAKMNPEEIENVLHIMNETKVEFTVPYESAKGDGNRPLTENDAVQHPEPHTPGGKNDSSSNL
jgi:hypothetical protein